MVEFLKAVFPPCRSVQERNRIARNSKGIRNKIKVLKGNRIRFMKFQGNKFMKYPLYIQTTRGTEIFCFLSAKTVPFPSKTTSNLIPFPCKTTADLINFLSRTMSKKYNLFLKMIFLFKGEVGCEEKI